MKAAMRSLETAEAIYRRGGALIADQLREERMEVLAQLNNTTAS